MNKEVKALHKRFYTPKTIVLQSALSRCKNQMARGMLNSPSNHIIWSSITSTRLLSYGSLDQTLSYQFPLLKLNT